jgi:prepilin-type N-terminal cleavage/methylation domain-containing protein
VINKEKIHPQLKQLWRTGGFTLIELLIVIVILGLLAMAAIVALNPQMLVGKANDARRKNDLNKIRIAFEEYFNDKGYYPTYETLTEWNTADNCGKTVIGVSKYLEKWRCGPNNETYVMITDGDWFKVVTNLENKKDKDIPDGWYTGNTSYTTVFARNEVNYGVSSANVLWYEGEDALGLCGAVCLKLNSNGCNDAAGVGCSYPDNCYLGTCSITSCRTSSCN